METQNDDPKVIRSEWKIWLELERADYYDDEDAPEDYIDEEYPLGIAYRPTREAAIELMEEIEHSFSEMPFPSCGSSVAEPPDKRFYLYNIKIQNGEYEHNSRSVHALPKDADANEYAEEYVSDFYHTNAEKDGDWYYFNGGEIAAKMLSVTEITENEYYVFRKFSF